MRNKQKRRPLEFISAPKDDRDVSILLFVARGSPFEDGEKGFLRDVALADAFHALFAFFLFFEELAFAGDVAAVALGQNVFTYRRDCFARDHAAANGGLNRHLE